MKQKFGIILAAGKGTRMKSSLYKVMHPVCGKPMVEHVVDQVEKTGATEIVAIVGHGAEMVQNHLGDRVSYAVQAEQLGTGHAVLQAESLLKEKEGTTIVICGDTPLLTSATLTALMEEHERTGAKATILTAIAEDPTGYGRVIRDENGSVLKNVEQKDASVDELKVQEIKQEVQQHLDHGRETQVQSQQQGQPSSTVVGVEEEKPAAPVAPAEKPVETTTNNGEKPADTVKPTEEQPTTQVVTPTIRKESVKTVTPIKHGVIERTDATLPKGERKVIQNGRDGSITVVTTTVYEDGVVKSSTQVSKEVVDAIDEIVLVGTKEAQPVVTPEQPTTTTEAPKPVAPVVTPEKPSTTTETPQQEKPVVTPEQPSTTTEAPKPVAPVETPEQPTTTTEAPKPVAPVEVKTKETRTVRELTVETETINDASIPTGKEVVDNDGKAGYVEQDFEITTVDGVKTGEKAIGAERTVTGTKRVVRKGTGTAAPYARVNENTKKYATLEALNNATDAELSAIKKGDLDFKSTSKTKNLEEAKQIAKYGNEHLDVLKVNDEFAKLMNAERAKKGVAPLTVDRELVRLAGIRSAELANQKDGASIYVNGKAHVRTDGSSFSTIYKEYQGERPAFKGENSLGNIEVVTDAKNFLNETQVAKMMYEQWAASPGHYANMMSGNFQTFGVDIEYGATSQGYGNYSGMSGVGTTLFGGSIN